MYSQIFTLQADLYKALANPKRVEIIHLLRENEMSVGQIQEMLDLPQANVSQHLTILRRQKIVITRKVGKEIFYKLSHHNLLTASDLIRELLIDLSGNTDVFANEMRLKMKDLVPVVKDPVCEMRISPKTAGYALSYNNQNYFFCAEGCLNKFKAKPKTYL